MGPIANEQLAMAHVPKTVDKARTSVALGRPEKQAP